MSSKPGAFFTSIILSILFMAIGCNSYPETAQVSGKVTFDGKPLEFGTVMFQNVTGGQPAVGKINGDGSFQLSTFKENDGAILGNHRVRVVCYSTQSPDSEGPTGDSLGQLLIPQRYTSLGASGISAEVTSDGLENFLIELSSKRQ